jgi:orotate phosphoribosyltransferase
VSVSELFRILSERSVKFGDFTLASGAKSDVYIDVRATSLAGDGATLIGKAFWSHMKEHHPGVRGVAGLTLGADPLVTATAIAAHHDDEYLDAIIVRKEAKGHGTAKRIEAPGRVTAGDEVVVVDDVITSGGSTLKAVHALRDAGFIVKHAICVVDRQAGGEANLQAEGISLHALFTLADFRE